MLKNYFFVILVVSLVENGISQTEAPPKTEGPTSPPPTGKSKIVSEKREKIFPSIKISGKSLPKKTMLTEYPFAARVSNIFMEHVCDGVVFGLRQVLTGCNCVVFQSKGAIYQEISNRYLALIGPGGGGIFNPVYKIDIHPYCNAITGKTWVHNFAILTISRIDHKKYPSAVVIANDAKSIKTSFTSLAKSTVTCKIVGWGSTGARTLMEVDIMLLKPDGVKKCFEDLCSNFNTFCKKEATDGNSCGKIQGDSRCLGNSSAPVLCNGKLYGLLNWAPPCKKQNDFPIVINTADDGYGFFRRFIDNKAQDKYAPSIFLILFTFLFSINDLC